jgi:Domain of unknown function (DUF4349)
METAIDYLNRVHGDLLDAAARERPRVAPTRPPTQPPWPKLVAAGVALLLAAGLVGLIARSGGLGDSGGTTGTADGAATGATGAAGDLAPQRDALEQPGSSTPSRVIRTAQISVVVPRDAFDERFGDAVDVAEANGGFVADSSSRSRSGSLTVRVPARAFDETLRALRALGTVEVQSVHGKDVTADYVDLRARLRIARSRRQVLLDLMNEATSIEQTIRVQNALDETQLRIEELQGQLRLLDDRTSLATIRLALREKGVEAEAVIETPSLPNAFEQAAAGFVGVIAAIVIGIGHLLPLLAIGLGVWFVVVRLRRRRPG